MENEIWKTMKIFRLKLCISALYSVQGSNPTCSPLLSIFSDSFLSTLYCKNLKYKNKMEKKLHIINLLPCFTTKQGGAFLSFFMTIY